MTITRVRKQARGMASSVVRLDQVSKIYPARWQWGKGRTAVERVNLEVHPGEVLGLIGPNRAGKTTIVKMLLSLCRPSQGSIERFGHPGTDRRTLKHLGYVHEQPAFPRYHSAASLLEYYGSLSLVPPAELKRRIPILLEEVGLRDRAEEPIAGYSKGMVQRLALAQALLSAPELLVLDEPNEGLDLGGRALVRNLVGEQRRRGRSVLLVSHLLADIEQLCDRVAVLVKGRLVFCGQVTDLTRGAGVGFSGSLEKALTALYEGSAQ